MAKAKALLRHHGVANVAQSNYPHELFLFILSFPIAALTVDLAALPPLEDVAPQKSRPSRAKKRGPDMSEILLSALAVQAHDVLITFKNAKRGPMTVQVKKSVVAESGELFLIGVNTENEETECFSFSAVAGKISANGKSWQRMTFVRDVLGYQLD